MAIEINADAVALTANSSIISNNAVKNPITATHFFVPLIALLCFIKYAPTAFFNVFKRPPPTCLDFIFLHVFL